MYDFLCCHNPGLRWEDCGEMSFLRLHLQLAQTLRRLKRQVGDHGTTGHGSDSSGEVKEYSLGDWMNHTPDKPKEPRLSLV